jgi:dihydroneopterin aldolase
MGQIALEGLEFFAFHGYYDEEQKIGNKYGVDLYIKTDLLAAGESDKLHETVNYEILYRLVAEEMRAPARLLEHVAHRVLDRIVAELPGVRKVKINVSKFNPPLGGICHRARVTLTKHRERPGDNSAGALR